VAIPVNERVKAGIALIVFVTAVGAALALILLVLGLFAAQALGGI
jgi:hypothetical protein